MTNYEHGHLGLNDEARDAAEAYAHSLGMSGGLVQMKTTGLSTWVFTDGDPYSPEPDHRPQVALRLKRSDDPAALLARSTQQVRLAQALRAASSSDAQSLVTPIQNFIAPPARYGQLVAQASEYLPFPRGSWHSCGVSIAQVSNQAMAHPEVTVQAPVFDPLGNAREAQSYLVEHAAALGLPSKLLEEIWPTQLEQARYESTAMLDRCRQLGQPLTLVEPDVNPNNILNDIAQRATLLDLRLMQGPAEYSLARPLGQWALHFGRPQSWGKDLQKGYEQASARPIDKQILAYAINISRVEHAATPFRLLARLIRQDRPPVARLLEEGLRRINTVGTVCLWKSLHA